MPDMTELLELAKKQGTAFQEFRTKNDARLNKIDHDLDEVVKRANRPGFPDHTPEQSEHKQMFDAYVRHGDDEAGLRKIQTKAMSMGDDPNGGYFVPAELDETIHSLVRSASPLRQLARVVDVATTDIKFIVSLSDLASGWVDELDSRPLTSSGTLAIIQPAFGELYSAVSVSQQLIDDSFIDLDAFLSADIAKHFAATEQTAFFTGNGISQPRGFLDYDTSTDIDGTRSFGVIEYIPSGAAGAFATGAGSSDSLVNLVHALKPAHRQNASWLMSSGTLGEVRKIRDAAGDPIFVQAIGAGTPSTLFGYPVYESAGMPTIAANSLSIAFGDFQSGYLIADRKGMTLLRDPFTSRGSVILYVTKRVGGALIDSEAIKVMKFASS